jgi:CubicO group peptidase (beta-lactamase class C family)
MQPDGTGRRLRRHSSAIPAAGTLQCVRRLLGRLREIQDALDDLSRRCEVPGAALAVGHGEEIFDFATGVVNVDTGVETTTDSVFQIGSNTKLFTATLVMQLVDAGQVTLDAPVRRYLPGFTLADDAAAQHITVRQLLTHTSGIEGDYFEGFGQNDDAIERYVDSLDTIGLVHPPGRLWSYCNSGFVVAGRLVEALTGTPYHQLLRERICGPLGLSRTTVQADEMLAQRCAVGHVPGPGGRPMVPPVILMQYAQAPAGSRTVATAAELVRFVHMHLESGAAPNGDAVLSGAAAAAMQEPQFPRPPISSSPQAQGLGWLMEEWDGKRVIGHGGGTIGQLSFLESVPEERLTVALQTNSVSGGLLWRKLGGWLFEELAGLRMATPLRPPTPSPELPLGRYTGTYERLGVRHVIAEDDGHLVVRTEMTGPLTQVNPQGPPPPLRLRPIDEERFAVRMNGEEAVVVFTDFERGRPNYLFAGRVARRRRRRRRPPG